MSIPPSKRSHEEGGNGSGNFNHMSISKYPHVDSTALPGTGSKFTASGTTDYHTPHEVAQESRMQKIPRTEVRDLDRKSPLVPIFRASSSSNDIRSDRPSSIESRVDFKDSWNNNRDFKVETKIESRNLHQVAKVEKDRKFDGKTEDNKETNPGKDTYADRKCDVKSDKEGSSLITSQLNCKDSKDQYRGKSYPDDTVGNADSRYSARAISHVPAEAGKQGVNTEEKEHHEFHEIVGRNKIDLKVDDKVKDKDMKRKEGKHRDWGEVDKERNDRRNTLPLGGSSLERDVLKEERDAERWNRERKDILKDKEKPKEIEEIMKKEPWRGAEKEGPHKERLEISGSLTDQDEVVSEQKKQNENLKERKEIDGEVHAERADTHNKFNDKESDEGMDAEGGTGKEKEGTQHRKKMLRPRASPRANHDPHISHSQDTDRHQGTSLVPTVVYRVGECMEEIVKLWKEFESSQADRVSCSSDHGPTLEISIPAEHVSATNRQVRGGQLWGTDIYTNDSDLVAVLMHTGYLKLTASPPRTIKELRATIRVLPSQDSYISTLRNNVRSRAWGAGIGCSLRVERCLILKEDGGSIDLKPCLAQSSTLEPTLAPVAVERTMTTRAAASNALRQQRFVREVTIQFNLSNEPWLKYSISVVADKGLKKPLFTSSRLKKGEVLYLESHTNRYELCFHEERTVKTSQALEAECDKFQKLDLQPSSSELKVVDGDNAIMYIDVFRWSRCKKFFTGARMRSIGIPLPLEHVEVLEDNLEWDDIQWSQTGVVIAGKQYNLARAHFLSQN